MHLRTLERLNAEFGRPSVEYRWSLQPTKPGRATVNVFVDGENMSKEQIRVWVFDPAKATFEEAMHADIRSPEDLEGLIARIKMAIEAAA